jgi:hypothetical protein
VRVTFVVILHVMLRVIVLVRASHGGHAAPALNPSCGVLRYGNVF